MPYKKHKKGKRAAQNRAACKNIKANTTRNRSSNEENTAADSKNGNSKINKRKIAKLAAEKKQLHNLLFNKTIVTSDISPAKINTALDSLDILLKELTEATIIETKEIETNKKQEIITADMAQPQGNPPISPNVGNSNASMPQQRHTLSMPMAQQHCNGYNLPPMQQPQQSINFNTQLPQHGHSIPIPHQHVTSMPPFPQQVNNCNVPMPAAPPQQGSNFNILMPPHQSNNTNNIPMLQRGNSSNIPMAQHANNLNIPVPQHGHNFNMPIPPPLQGHYFNNISMPQQSKNIPIPKQFNNIPMPPKQSINNIPMPPKQSNNNIQMQQRNNNRNIPMIQQTHHYHNYPTSGRYYSSPYGHHMYYNSSNDPLQSQVPEAGGTPPQQQGSPVTPQPKQKNKWTQAPELVHDGTDTSDDAGVYSARSAYSYASHATDDRRRPHRFTQFGKAHHNFRHNHANGGRFNNPWRHNMTPRPAYPQQFQIPFGHAPQIHIPNCSLMPPSMPCNGIEAHGSYSPQSQPIGLMVGGVPMHPPLTPTTPAMPVPSMFMSPRPPFNYGNYMPFPMQSPGQYTPPPYPGIPPMNPPTSPYSPHAAFNMSPQPDMQLSPTDMNEGVRTPQPVAAAPAMPDLSVPPPIIMPDMSVPPPPPPPIPVLSPQHLPKFPNITTPAAAFNVANNESEFLPPPVPPPTPVQNFGKPYTFDEFAFLTAACNVGQPSSIQNSQQEFNPASFDVVNLSQSPNVAEAYPYPCPTADESTDIAAKCLHPTTAEPGNDVNLNAIYGPTWPTERGEVYQNGNNEINLPPPTEQQINAARLLFELGNVDDIIAPINDNDNGNGNEGLAMWYGMDQATGNVNNLDFMTQTPENPEVATAAQQVANESGRTLAASNLSQTPIFWPVYPEPTPNKPETNINNMMKLTSRLAKETFPGDASVAAAWCHAMNSDAELFWSSNTAASNSQNEESEAFKRPIEMMLPQSLIGDLESLSLNAPQPAAAAANDVATAENVAASSDDGCSDSWSKCYLKDLQAHYGQFMQHWNGINEERKKVQVKIETTPKMNAEATNASGGGEQTPQAPDAPGSAEGTNSPRLHDLSNHLPHPQIATYHFDDGSISLAPAFDEKSSKYKWPPSQKSAAPLGTENESTTMPAYSNVQAFKTYPLPPNVVNFNTMPDRKKKHSTRTGMNNLLAPHERVGFFSLFRWQKSKNKPKTNDCGAQTNLNGEGEVTTDNATNSDSGSGETKDESIRDIGFIYWDEKHGATVQMDVAEASESLLFYMFYMCVDDKRVQLHAAQELHRRSWRYHLAQKVWLLLTDVVDSMKNNNPACLLEGTFVYFNYLAWKFEICDVFIHNGQLDFRQTSPLKLIGRRHFAYKMQYKI